jgi:4-amino-4-deoxy-L-arabinose transferase-like glycosyltransferase
MRATAVEAEATAREGASATAGDLVQVRRRAGVAVAMAGIMLVATLLYGWRLGEAPVYLSPDEAIIATDAHALATTGRDNTGTWFPLYFFIQVPGDDRSGWFMPGIFYLSAAVFQLFPLTEWSARLSTVLMAVTGIGVMYLLAVRLFRRQWVAVAVAMLLALAPGHFILARYALDYLFPIPFIGAWLLFLHRTLERSSARDALWAGACLGVGFYSYISSMLMMPLYAALSLLVLFRSRAGARQLINLIAGAVVPLIAFAVWFVQHPDAFAATAQRYALYDTTRLNALQGVREFLSFPNIERMASLYWSFFNPSFLFLSGDSQMMFSTRSAGVLVTVMVVLLPAGIAQILGRDRTSFNLLVIAGFFTAPAAAVLVPESAALNRSAALLPFGVLLGGFGLIRLANAAPLRLSRTRKVVYGPALVGLLLALAGLQFTAFARDYFGDYQLRVSTWLGGNLRGALETLIQLDARGNVPAIYFAPLQSEGRLSDTRNRWMPVYWDFYTIKHGRIDLQARSHKLSETALDTVRSGSLVLANVNDPDTTPLVERGALRELATIPELTNNPFFWILAKP